MKAYYFNDAQVSLLSGLMTDFTVSAALKVNEDNVQRQIFLMACAITAELHKPDVTDINTPVASRWDIQFDDGQTQAIPAFDPRAKHPHCVHGLPFKDENGLEVICTQCAKNWTDARLRETNELEAQAMAGAQFGEAQALSGANRDE
jgi:hypothetical protein